MDHQEEVERVTDSLEAHAEIDKDQRYNQTVAMVTIAASSAIWVAFLLWEDFRDRLMRDGLWWLPIAATLMIAVAAVIVSKKGRPPSSG